MYSMIIMDNGNSGSTIAREPSSGELEDKIDKEEERRSGLISRHHADPPTTEPRNQCI